MYIFRFAFASADIAISFRAQENAKRITKAMLIVFAMKSKQKAQYIKMTIM